MGADKGFFYLPVKVAIVRSMNVGLVCCDERRERFFVLQHARGQKKIIVIFLVSLAK